MKEKRLTEIAEGRRCVLLRISSEGAEKRHMLELGLTRKTAIEVLQRSPSGDPTAYFFRGAVIAIRRENAEKIFVEPEVIE